MRRNKLNFSIDALALLAMLGMIATGLVVRYVLPAGSGGHGRGGGLALWGWDRHQWGDLHFWFAVGMTGLLAVHVVLHWDWVCSIARRLLPGGETGSARLSSRSRALWGTLTVLSIAGALALFTWVALSAVVTRDGARNEAGMASLRGGGGGGRGQGFHSIADPGPGVAGSGSDEPKWSRHEPAESHEIRGYMTLEQAALAAGVPIHDLRQKLGLPDSVSDQDRLGQLRRSHGLELPAVRDAVRAIRAAAAQ